MNHGICTAIVLAAGQGRRMGTKTPKQFLSLGGKPVLAYSLQCFQESPLVDEILLVTGEEMQEYCRREILEAYHLTKVRKIVSGGAQRYDSVFNGLSACRRDTAYVLIHDGARPFVTGDMVRRTMEAVWEYGACTTGMPSKDTVKIADDRGCVKSTPPRSRVWNVQTPQAFSYPLLLEAYACMRGKDMSQVTDDAMLVERMGGVLVKFVEGSYKNMKITTPEDLQLAELLLTKSPK